MNIKYSLLPAIVVADIATKNMKHLDSFDHQRVIHWWSLLFLLPLIYYAYRKPRYRLPAFVMVTGGFLNYSDSLNGVVINPFIIIANTNGVGFNMADLAILLGFAGGIREGVKERKEKKKAKLKIGSAEWNNA